MIFLNIFSNYYIKSEEIDEDEIKPSKNIEENDEFEDPSLLKKEQNNPQKKKNKKENKKYPDE